MLLLYGPLGGYLLGVGRLPAPWQALPLTKQRLAAKLRHEDDVVFAPPTQMI